MKITVMFCFCLLLRKSDEKPNFFEHSSLHFFGTKTPYRFVGNLVDRNETYPGCLPSKILGIIRHGTRNPAEKAIQKIQMNLSQIKLDIFENCNNLLIENNMCGKLKSQLMGWKFESDTIGPKFLTEEGRQEMFSLAKRLQKRFSTLLPTTFKNDSFLFRFTKTQRTEESAKYFVAGLFGFDNEVWFPQPLYNDPILRFYKLCKRWKKEVKKNPLTKKETQKFIRRGEVHKALEDISNRIGLNYTLSFDSVHQMYLSCSFETAWNPKMIPVWCLIFQDHEMKIFEYVNELKYYWQDGYGYEINHKQSCPLFKNILHFLLGENDNYKSVFYFTHSGTLLKAISRLGLFKDPFKLTADVPIDDRENRLWRVSFIDSFATNLMFVVFRCDGEEDKILVLHQEVQVHLPGCPEPPQLCSISKIKDILSPDITCNFTEICGIPS